MHVTLVYVSVKEASIEAFKKATEKNHRGAVKEEGNVRFDVMQHREDPSSFVLYEVYRSEEDAQKHKETAHYLAWREEVAPMMAKKREGVPYSLLFPEEEAL